MLRNSGSVALATVTYSDTKPDRFTVIFGLGWVGLGLREGLPYHRPNTLLLGYCLSALEECQSVYYRASLHHFTANAFC